MIRRMQHDDGAEAHRQTRARFAVNSPASTKFNFLSVTSDPNDWIQWLMEAVAEALEK